MTDADGSSTPRPLLVVAGVSGAGKSTIGELAAERLGVPFADADDLHSAANVSKMAAGTPLVDDDRWPWLRAVGRALADAGESGAGLVVACSALKASYRRAILTEAPDVRFVLLAGSPETLSARIGARTGHFMPATLLGSQLLELEPLGPGEPGFEVQIEGSPENIVDAIARRVVLTN